MTRLITHHIYDNSFPAETDYYPKIEILVRVNRVGKIAITATAPIRTLITSESPTSGNQVLPGTPRFSIRKQSFNWSLYDPSGNVFLKDHITMDDLNRFRSPRGLLNLDWKLVIEKYVFSTQDSVAIENITANPRRVNFKIIESLVSVSAPPLVDKFGEALNPEKTYRFDLYRIGNLKINTRVTQLNQGFKTLEDQLEKSKRTGVPINPKGGLDVDTQLTLYDPDGRVAAKGSNTINFYVTLQHLRLSRGTERMVRHWRLVVSARSRSKYQIFAQVYETLRFPSDILLKRLNYICGSSGENFILGANWDEEKKTNRFTLIIKDEKLADTLALHGALSKLDPDLNNNLNLNHPEVDKLYVLFEESLIQEKDFLDIDFTAQPKCKNLKSEKFFIKFGKSIERRALKVVQITGGGRSGMTTYQVLPQGEVIIPANVPCAFIDLTMSGSIYFDINNFDDANIKINIHLEIGFSVTENGIVKTLFWVDPDSIQYAGLEGNSVFAAVKTKVYNTLIEKLVTNSDVFDKLIVTILGGSFTLLSARWLNNAIEFEYIAGKELERQPTKGYVPGHITEPSSVASLEMLKEMADKSWKSPNLTTNKIDHIVVLIMENRSFDHVLGHLSLEDKNAPGIPAKNKDVRGLTQGIIDEFKKLHQYEIADLKNAKFKANQGLKTQIPLHIGHDVDDVTQQLAIADNKPTMGGFVKNLKKVNNQGQLEEENCNGQEAVGYYTDHELSMYGFLAKEFAICDNYFCSHPGPTLPNRMYCLTGDLQRDRNGEPIIHNRLSLSREPTIFDLLTQRNVSWRVYESAPSVTMLRLFSRYAGDNQNIRDIGHLKADILSEATKFPSVTFIDPRMHNAPANDDHPPADMLCGQNLVKDIYESLRSNDVVWKKTLFIITYDEHGGLFDHVPPPIAETSQGSSHSTIANASSNAESTGVGNPVKPRVVRDNRKSAGSLRQSADLGKPSPLPNPIISSSVIIPVTNTPNDASSVSNERDLISLERPLDLSHIGGNNILYGVRVPTFLVSPWIEPGHVDHTLFDHTSILKTILIRFCSEDKPFLSDRVNYANDLGIALTRANLRTNITEAPTLPYCEELTYTKTPKINKASITSDQADWHDIVEVMANVFKPL